jgi:hypothetical protein
MWRTYSGKKVFNSKNSEIMSGNRLKGVETKGVSL